MNGRLRVLGAVALLGLVAPLTSCGFDGAQSLPAPGAIGGDDTYAVTVVLADAGSLAPKQTCRANDVVVGSVESIELDDALQAVVTCRIKKSITLPENIAPRLVQTSLLGERFVALDPPRDAAPVGALARGARIDVARTTTEPDTEVVLGALSQVLNGGSLGSIQRIVAELDSALAGGDLKGALRAARDTTTTLDGRKESVLGALTSIDRLAAGLAEQRSVIASALDSVPQGLAVLERQRTRLVSTLVELSRLSNTVVPFLDDVRTDLAADLRDLAPVLRQLSTVSDQLAATVRRALTFPFPSTILSAVKGDFTGAIANVDIDLDLLNQLLAPTTSTPTPPPQSAGTPSGTSGPARVDPVTPLLPEVTRGLDALLGGLLGGLR